MKVKSKTKKQEDAGFYLKRVVLIGEKFIFLLYP